MLVRPQSLPLPPPPELLESYRRAVLLPLSRPDAFEVAPEDAILLFFVGGDCKRTQDAALVPGFAALVLSARRCSFGADVANAQ